MLRAVRQNSRFLRPFLQQPLRYFSAVSEVDSFLTAARESFTRGDFRGCVESNRKVVALAKTKSAEVPTVKLAAAHINSAYVLKQLCEYQEAKVEIEAGLALLETQFSSMKVQVAEALDLLAEILVGAEELESAEKHVMRSIEMKQAWGDKDLPALATSHNVLGAIRLEMGKLEPARASFREALRIHLEDGLSIPAAIALSNYAGVLKAEKKLNACLKAYEEATKAFEAHLPAQDPTVGMSLLEMGATMVKLGHHEAAVKHLQRSLIILGSSFGFEHPNTMSAIEWTTRCSSKDRTPEEHVDTAETTEIADLLAELRREKQEAKNARLAGRRAVEGEMIFHDLSGHVGHGNPMLKKHQYKDINPY